MGVRQFKFFHGITIESEGIQEIVRTLRARWNPNLVDDLADYDGIDAEAELTSLLANEMATAVDENIINELYRRINGGNRA